MFLFKITALAVDVFQPALDVCDSCSHPSVFQKLQYTFVFLLCHFDKILQAFDRFRRAKNLAVMLPADFHDGNSDFVRCIGITRYHGDETDGIVGMDSLTGPVPNMLRPSRREATLL